MCMCRKGQLTSGIEHLPLESDISSSNCEYTHEPLARGSFPSPQRSRLATNQALPWFQTKTWINWCAPLRCAFLQRLHWSGVFDQAGRVFAQASRGLIKQREYPLKQDHMWSNILPFRSSKPIYDQAHSHSAQEPPLHQRTPK